MRTELHMAAALSPRGFTEHNGKCYCSCC